MYIDACPKCFNVPKVVNTAHPCINLVRKLFILPLELWIIFILDVTWNSFVPLLIIRPSNVPKCQGLTLLHSPALIGSVTG